MDSIKRQSFRLRSGYALPVLGLDTWQLVGSRCERIVSQALELGYRHFDTAELYGNESEIGRALAQVSLRWLLQKGAVVLPKPVPSSISEPIWIWMAGNCRRRTCRTSTRSAWR